MNNTPDKTLIIMVGLPFSGKSTKALETGYPIVSPEGVRLAIHGRNYCAEAEGLVWTFARYMVHSLFNAGHDNVVLDGCHTKLRRRQQWESPKWRRQFYVMTTTVEECAQRAEVIKDEILRSNIQESIARMELEYEPVSREEGEIIICDYADYEA